jgi:hypothetical protein
VFTNVAVSASSTYQYDAFISVVSANTGTAGVQAGLTCSSVVTIEGAVMGTQSTTTLIGFRQAASGVVTSAIERLAGNGTTNTGVKLKGTLVTSTGSPVVNVQIKGVQASTNWYTRATANSIVLIKVS